MATPVAPLTPEQIQFVTEYIQNKIAQEEDSNEVPFPETMCWTESYKAENHVNYKFFDPLRIIVEAVVPGEAKENKSIKFKQAAIKYLHAQYGPGGQEFNIVERFLLEGPEMKSDRGLDDRVNKFSQKREKMIRTQFDPKSKDQTTFLAVLEEVYLALCGEITRKAKDFGFHAGKTAAPVSNYGYKPLVSVPVDADGTPTGKASMFLKTRFYAAGMKDGVMKPDYNGTRFQDIDLNRMEDSDIVNSEITFIPVIDIKSIFAGVQKAIQYSLSSAIITDCTPLSDVNAQVATATAYREANPEKANEWRNKLAALRAKKAANKADVSGGDQKPASNTMAPGSFEADLDGLTNTD